MICKSLKMMAMVCLLATAASISIGTASEEGAIDLIALNVTDEVTMIDEVDEMNTTTPNSTNQSSNESSAAEDAPDLSAIDAIGEESMTDEVEEVNDTPSSDSTVQPSDESNESSSEGVNVSVVDLSTLEDGSKDQLVAVYQKLPQTNGNKEAVHHPLLLGPLPQRHKDDLVRHGTDNTDDEEGGDNRDRRTKDHQGRVIVLKERLMHRCDDVIGDKRTQHEVFAVCEI